MTFVGLILRNLTVKPLRTALTAIAVAVGVAAGVTIGIVTHSLRETAVQILQIGQADFSVTQKGVSDVLNSSMDEQEIADLAADPDVESTVGVLVGMVKLNADNPMFLEIGIPPDRLEAFGVRVVAGRAYAATATDELMLGFRAARNLDKSVGDTMVVDGNTYTVVGIFSTGQEFGDAASMLPLVTLQANERKSGDVTIAFVRVRPGADIDAVRRRIETKDPQLITVHTVAEFGRADRNLQLLSAADTGVTILALAIGVIIVANSMLLSFSERTREFGVLRAIGWSRRRVVLLVVGETLAVSLVGAAVGVSLSYLAIQVLQHVSALSGILHPAYTAGVFGRALATATGIGFLGAAYPALRAALLVPLEALRRE
ncbi:MAG: ABC transporter permease [Actinomycetota bacterium]